jgi:hypothetical protein
MSPFCYFTHTHPFAFAIRERSDDALPSLIADCCQQSSYFGELGEQLVCLFLVSHREPLIV